MNELFNGNWSQIYVLPHPARPYAGLCVLASNLNVHTKPVKLTLTCISTCNKPYPRGCICLAVYLSSYLATIKYQMYFDCIFYEFQNYLLPIYFSYILKVWYLCCGKRMNIVVVEHHYGVYRNLGFVLLRKIKGSRKASAPPCTKVLV